MYAEVDDYLLEPYIPLGCESCYEKGMGCSDNVCALSEKELHGLEDYERLMKHYGVM